jgi:divalent metal cation (Fe/Co/Zn/Cd) transporter
MNTTMAATPSTDRETVIKKAAARLSIVVAVFLIALKATSGWLTGSIGVSASLLDSTSTCFLLL